MILPTSQLPKYFQVVSGALREIMLRGASLSDVSTEIGVLILFAIGMLTAAAITVRKT